LGKPTMFGTSIGEPLNGVNVTQGIGGGNLSEGIRVVYHRGDLVYGLRQGQFVAEPVHSGSSFPPCQEIGTG